MAEKPKKKTFLILGLLLIILALAGAIFGAYKLGQRQVQPVPTPDLTVDWGTYTNPQYGYSIKYPPDWGIGIEIASFAKDGYSLGIAPSTQELYRPSPTMVATSTVRVGDKSYLKSTWKLPDGEIDLEKIDLEREDKLEIVLIYKDGLYSEEYGRVFDLMLSTFKFLPYAAGRGQCARDSDCTLAIRLDQCCSCPEPVSLKILEQDNNLVKYEEGKDYSREIKVNCKNTVCDSCPPIEKPICQSGVCKSSFLDQGSGGEKVFCKDPRPEICTMECVAQPPYICGSDGKFYCNKCATCANPKVEWYVVQDNPCIKE